MAFGLGKSEKRPEDEDSGREEGLAGDGDGRSPDVSDSGNGRDPAAGDVEVEDGADSTPSQFRPSYLDEEVRGGAPTPAQPAREQPAGDAFFVSVIREDGARVHRFDHAAEAQAFVERLLTDGVRAEEVTAFSGRRLSLEISQRPVVKLHRGREE